LFKPEGSNLGERILSSVAAFGFSRHHQRIDLRSKTGPGVEILLKKITKSCINWKEFSIKNFMELQADQN